MIRPWFNRIQADFFTGLAIVLPIVISIALIYWIFGTVANFTDTLLIFLPNRVTHAQGGIGPVHWYWSLVAFALAAFLISVLGRLARYYLGKKLIEILDSLLRQVPLLNKVYSAIKQVNEAFVSNKKSSFQQVVLVEFPKQGTYSVGFVTSEKNPEIERKTGKPLVTVFVPTTPNPTTGFLLLLAPEEIQHLDMSVADGIKMIISLGSVLPEPGGKAGTLSSTGEPAGGASPEPGMPAP